MFYLPSNPTSVQDDRLDHFAPQGYPACDDHDLEDVDPRVHTRDFTSVHWPMGGTDPDELKDRKNEYRRSRRATTKQTGLPSIKPSVRKPVQKKREFQR